MTLQLCPMSTMTPNFLWSSLSPPLTTTHTHTCLALYSLGVVEAQSCLGKLLFCLDTLLPTSLYPLWSGRERCCGESDPGPQAPSSPGPTPSQLALPCALPCPVAFIPSSVLSPRPPFAVPTHLGPQGGSQTAPYRSRGRRLRGGQSSEVNSSPQIC